MPYLKLSLTEDVIDLGVITKPKGRDVSIGVANAGGWIGKDPDTEYHYVWIKNISRLLFKNNKHNGTVFVCRNCLHVCSSRDVYERHIKNCLQLNKSSQGMCFPLKEVNDSIQFKKFAATVSYPFAYCS